jgi:hypothetical protein
LNVPHDFVDQLAITCAGAMGLNATELKDAISKDQVTREQQAKLQQQANQAQAEQMIAEANQAKQQQPDAQAMAPTNPAGPPPVSARPGSSVKAAAGSPVPASLANVAGAVDTIYDLATGGER